MSQTQDPTFYRTPADVIAAPPERLAYVAAFDPAGQVKDAMTVLDTDPSSPDYGQIVGWSELPTAGNELHHFGWNACSSALCHQGHADHGAPLECRYLIEPRLCQCPLRRRPGRSRRCPNALLPARARASPARLCVLRTLSREPPLGQYRTAVNGWEGARKHPAAGR